MSLRKGIGLALVGLALTSGASAFFDRGGPLGYGTRALGMGGAWAAADGDLSSLYWNPAGLAGVGGSEMTLESGTILGGRNNLVMGGMALAALEDFKLALQSDLLFHQGTGGLSERRIEAAAGFKPKDSSMDLGAGLRFLNLGGVAGLQASGFAMDLGASGRLMKNSRNSIGWGLVLQDLAGSLTWRDGPRQKLPAWISAGLSANPGGTALFALDMSSKAWGPGAQDSTGLIRGGMELKLMEGRALFRAGYVGYPRQTGLWTAGISALGRSWQAHYAFCGEPGSLGASHRFSFLYAFRNPSWEAPGASSQARRDKITKLEEALTLVRGETSEEELAAESLRKGRSGLPRKNYGPLEKQPLYKKGLVYMAQGDFAKEIRAWKRLLEAYPDDPRLTENLARAQERLDKISALEKAGGAKP